MMVCRHGGGGGEAAGGAGGTGTDGGVTAGNQGVTSSPGGSMSELSTAASSGTQKGVLHFGQSTWLPAFFRGTRSGCLHRGQSKRNGMVSAPWAKEA
jgi:hypothetical protein